MNATEAWVGESRYVYQLPLRLVHWIIFLDLIVLSISGYWIGSGDLPAGPGGEFQMGTIRYVHTLAGWVLFAALLRIYLFFFGNVYARWTDFIPHRREHWRDVKEVLLFYTFIRRGYPHAEYGHNRLASLTYLVVYLLILFMVVSGASRDGISCRMAGLAHVAPGVRDGPDASSPASPGNVAPLGLRGPSPRQRVSCR